jgi:predicted acyl esterase
MRIQEAFRTKWSAARIGVGITVGLAALLTWALAAHQAAKQTVLVPMADGVKLATDLYLPEGSGPFPVILMRTPYNKDQGAGIGQEGARRGYALVCQDTRGRFASQGEGIAFIGDGWGNLKDGYETLEWIAKQPWCNGKIGTWGGSALGITQIGMAGTGTTRLTCQHITVAPASLYHYGLYPGGVFRKALIEDWLRGSGHSPKTLDLWSRHPDLDTFWRGYDLTADYSRVSAPAVFIGGWYDIFSQGTIEAFAGYQSKSAPKARGHSKLVMGPWTHGVGQEKAGELTFTGGSRIPGNVNDPWRWFDYQLKGVDNGVEKQPAVTYYVMGDTSDPSAPGNVWRTADRWPPQPSKPTPYYFTSSHGLSPAKPGKSDPLSYSYDPKDPVPSIGGAQLSIPAGPMDQRKTESRPDVLVFTGEVLEAPLEITGRVRAHLWASSDARDTDFLARLCDVYPDGRSINLCEGSLRARFREGLQHEELLTPGQTYEFNLDLWSTSIILNKGHRLRVHITSSSAPGNDPNPNTGSPFRSDTKTQIAHNTLFLDSAHPSHILLPVIPAGSIR